MYEFARAQENDDERFHQVSLSLDSSLVLLCRTPRSYADDSEIAHETVRLGAVLDRIGRSSRRLLVDARQAPIDTDTRLSSSFRSQRRELRNGFIAVAVVVKTKVGRLQATRLAGELGPDGADPVFDDYAAALEYLRQR